MYYTINICIINVNPSYDQSQIRNSLRPRGCLPESLMFKKYVNQRHIMLLLKSDLTHTITGHMTYSFKLQDLDVLSIIQRYGKSKGLPWILCFNFIWNSIQLMQKKQLWPGYQDIFLLHGCNTAAYDVHTLLLLKYKNLHACHTKGLPKNLEFLSNSEFLRSWG